MGRRERSFRSQRRLPAASCPFHVAKRGQNRARPVAGLFPKKKHRQVQVTDASPWEREINQYVRVRQGGGYRNREIIDFWVDFVSCYSFLATVHCL